MGLFRIAIITVMAVLQAVFGAPEFLSGSGPVWTRALAYPFFHGSWWHLAVNSLAVWTVYNPRRKFLPVRELLMPFIISFIVYPVPSRPVIGFSNVLYAVLGTRTPPLSSPWWKRTEVVVFLAVTFALLLVPRFSAVTHIISFALGMLYAGADRQVRKWRSTRRS